MKEKHAKTIESNNYILNKSESNGLVRLDVAQKICNAYIEIGLDFPPNGAWLGFLCKPDKRLTEFFYYKDVWEHGQEFRNANSADSSMVTFSETVENFCLVEEHDKEFSYLKLFYTQDDLTEPKLLAMYSVKKIGNYYHTNCHYCYAVNVLKAKKFDPFQSVMDFFSCPQH